MSSRRIIDISPLVSTQTPVWPGDTPLQRSVLCNIAQGANIELSSLTSTVHIGAHADAPIHYHASGKSIADVSLEPYIGRCLVYAVSDACKKMQLITLEEVQKIDLQGCKRILFQTHSFNHDDSNFKEDFVSFQDKAIDFLAKSGVILIGIDTPSFDPFHSKDLPAHKKLYQHSLANLECLDLRNVRTGVYELIALPLKLKDFDASPVRAVLVSSE